MPVDTASKSTLPIEKQTSLEKATAYQNGQTYQCNKAYRIYIILEIHFNKLRNAEFNEHFIMCLVCKYVNQALENSMKKENDIYNL